MQHQIVITLNPEEYREIQRLAKMAGTTSIGQFLHTRLLTFLGMRNNKRLDTTYDTERTVDLTLLGDTITRMHKELKQLLDTGEITGYVTGTAPPEDIRDDLISFKFETILQNDYNSVPSQPMFLSAETVFSELGVTLPKSDSKSEFTLDSLPPPPPATEPIVEPVPPPISKPDSEAIPEPIPEPVPEPKSDSESESKPEQEPVSTLERKVDFRTKPQTPEEAIQAAKSIEDELERLAEQAFAQTPLSGVAPVPDTPIEPLAANDPLIDILDEGLVKILEEKTASKITSDFVKPNLNDAAQKKDTESQEKSLKELETNQDDSKRDQVAETDEDTPPSTGGFGPPPKKRKK